MRYQYGMSVGHSYMHRGRFPPANVPNIPDTFDYYDGVVAGEDDAAADAEAEDSEPGSSSLHYAPREINAQDATFYLEM